MTRPRPRHDRHDRHNRHRICALGGCVVLLTACGHGAPIAAGGPAQRKVDVALALPPPADSVTPANAERSPQSAFAVVARLLAGPPTQDWEPRELRMRSWSQADGVVRAEVELRHQELGISLLERLRVSPMFRDLKLERLDRQHSTRPLFVLAFSAKTPDPAHLEVRDEEAARAHLDRGTRNPFDDVSAQVPPRVLWVAEKTPVDRLMLITTARSGTDELALAVVTDDRERTGWIVHIGDALGMVHPEGDACQWRVTRIEKKAVDLERANASACESVAKSWRIPLVPKR